MFGRQRRQERAGEKERKVNEARREVGGEGVGTEAAPPQRRVAEGPAGA